MNKIILLILVILLAACAASPRSEYAVEPTYTESAPPPPASPPPPPPPVVGSSGSIEYEINRPVGSVEGVRHVQNRSEPVLEARAITADEVLSQIRQASLALTAPESRNIREVVPVKLLVSVEKTQQELIEELNAEIDSYVVSDNVSITKTMSATLTAPDFDVNVITPVRQAITDGSTEWLWSLRPKTSGKHHVTVTLVAHVMVDGERVEKHIKTFDKTLTIEITASQKFSDFIMKYWQWLFTTLLIPIGIGIWKIINKKKELPLS